jgi:hypothetical protein
LFTVTPPINADLETQDRHLAKILEWNILNGSPSPSLIPSKNSYTLGKPWCEPILIQGLGIPKFVDNGVKLVILSGGSSHTFESARVFEVPKNEKLSQWDDRSFPLEKVAPDWLLDLTAVLTGSGKEYEKEVEDRADTVYDIYQRKDTAPDNTRIYRTLGDKFVPAH